MPIVRRHTGLVFEPPAWVTGGISTADATFLVELVAQVQPETIVEVGIGAGTSSAALLFALDQLPGGGAGRFLYSVDLHARCYFDQARAVGSAVTEMYPDHNASWTRKIGGGAGRVGADLRKAGGLVDFAFVDGDHRHPWPLFDVLHVAPALRPEAWIALHDIALARVCPQFQSHGAEWLFSAWPETARAGAGEAENIGAVRLPADLHELVPMALDLLTRARWEAEISAAAVDLPPVFAALAPALRRRLRP